MNQHPSDSFRAPARLAWRVTRGCILVLAALGTTGCGGSLFESNMPVPTRYVLAPAPAAQEPVNSAASQVDLAIGNPDVAPGLESPRIAVLRGRELDYYRNAQWGGSLRETVQALLIATLQDQQLFRSVAAEQARISNAYLLDPEVRDFQAEYVDGKAAPDARVTIVGRVIRVRDRRLIDTLNATATAAATDNRMTAVSAAFEAAAQRVALQLAREAATVIANDVSVAGTAPAQ